MQPFRPALNISLAFLVLSVVAMVGCGSGGGVTLPNPQGSYSVSSINGSYVYEVHGTSLATNLPYREVGVFTADGAGHITAGEDEFEGAVVSGASTTVTGSYSVANDGTGFISLNSTKLGSITQVSQITFAITLVSSSRFQLIEADNFAAAAGLAELQTAAAISVTPSGTFVFRLHQEISAQNSAPASQVGIFMVPGSGVNGAMDQNLSGTLTSPNLTWTLSAPDSFGGGNGSFIDSNTSFQTTFIYFIVNAVELRLLVTNAGAVGSGGAEAQSGAVSGGLSGSYAFGSRGDDSNFQSGLFSTVATVGQFTASAGSISGVEDSMVDGNLSSSVPLSSCYSAASNGRVVVTGVSGASCSSTVTHVFWMVNPARAFFLDNAANSFEDGTADLQTTSSFTNATMNGQFALVMDGIDATPEELARVGTLQFNGSGKLALDELVNASATGAGATSPGLLSGTYTASANGRITGTLNGGTLHLVMYAVSGSQAYALQTDSGFITSGAADLQH